MNRIKKYNRRDFIQSATTAGLSLGLAGTVSNLYGNARKPAELKIGIIGLDTSHSIEIINALNATVKKPEFEGCRVVAAYPKGSADIASSAERIPKYTRQASDSGVEIVGSVKELLSKTDAVFLETNDGRMHLEQAMEVIRAHKPMFVDKPAAASLKDVMAIFEAAKKYNVPVFSSSSLRYISDAKEISEGRLIGRVLGADTYSPATLEKTHPDLFWYGIHGVEMLFTIMGKGCKSVVRTHSEQTDIVVGTWEDGRMGVFRGTRSGKHAYGGTVFGETGIKTLGDFKGTLPLIAHAVEFFRTGIAPVSPALTIEIYAFMAAADESKKNNGMPVSLDKVLKNTGISYSLND